MRSLVVFFLMSAMGTISAHANEMLQFAQCAGVGDAVVEHYDGEAPAEDLNVIAAEAHIFFSMAIDEDEDAAAALHLQRANARKEVLRLFAKDDGDAVHVPIQFCSDLRQELGREERFELP